MALMLETISPSSTNPKTGLGTGTEDIGTEGGTGDIPSTGDISTSEGTVPVTPVTPAMDLAAAAKAGQAAEAIIERLAYDTDKEYASSLPTVIQDLRKASSFLSETAGNITASLYYSNIADVLESVLTVPFADMETFSSRVGTMLTSLDAMYPADAAKAEAEKVVGEGETKVYYPKFDTDVNGAVTLAMLSLYSQQTVVSSPDKITVTVGGNIILGDHISTAEGSGFGGNLKNKYNGSFRYPIYRASALFCTDDISYVSLENPLTDSINMEDGFLSIKGPSEYAKILAQNGIDVATLTTEHIGDYGEDGIKDTVAALANLGITGVSADAHIQYRTVNGIKTAIISYNILDAKSDFKTQPKEDIAKAKSEGAVFVAVAFNWGNTNSGESIDYSSAIAGLQARTARAAIDNGASLVIGSHPHIMQALEIYKNKPIIYSAGDLSYAGQLDNAKASAEGYIFRQTFNVAEDGTVTMDGTVEVFPILNNTPENDYVTRPVFDSMAKSIVNDLLKYSKSSANGAKEKDISYITITK